MSQTNARRRALVLVLGLLASFAVLWITASVGDRAQAQQNTPATGTVTITGTVGIGEWERYSDLAPLGAVLIL